MGHLPKSEMGKSWSLDLAKQTLTFDWRTMTRVYKYQWPSNTWKTDKNGDEMFYPRQRWPIHYSRETERVANFEFLDRDTDSDRYDNLKQCVYVHIDKSG